ncbi:MAG TPA: carboxymuconolactone decarboxylase family protein [Streptosporangiaceae bacterium]|nr:carboxymuconolactone decarboxylase family protein [Streptosporangiaceae bacterium]
MSRIPSHTINDAPDAARPLLENLLQFSPTGKPLNLHAQMAHAPAVLEAYVGIRSATSSPGRLDQRTRVALMLASAVAAGSQYALAILTMLAARAGWGGEDVAALRSGKDAGGEKFARLLRVVREAASSSGRVSDAAWADAVEAGWSQEELAEAFGCLGLSVYTSFFLNYAATELDIPDASVVGAGAEGAGAGAQAGPATGTGGD